MRELWDTLYIYRINFSSLSSVNFSRILRSAQTKYCGRAPQQLSLLIQLILIYGFSCRNFFYWPSRKRRTGSCETRRMRPEYIFRAKYSAEPHKIPIYNKWKGQLFSQMKTVVGNNILNPLRSRLMAAAVCLFSFVFFFKYKSSGAVSVGRTAR